MRLAPLPRFPLTPSFLPQLPRGDQSLRLHGAPTTEPTSTQIYNAGYQLKDPHIETFRCSRISVSFEPPQRVTPDGEVLGNTPLEIEVVPRALEVFSL